MAKKKKTEADIQDEMVHSLHEDLNKKFKDQGYQVAYFIDEERDNPSNITDWISTGSDMLDVAISNRPDGGLPVGRIIEITGLEGSGKSLLCGHIIAETQKKGGLAVYIDTEHAMDESFFSAVGVDFEKLLYCPISGIEDAFVCADTIIEKVRKSSKDRVVSIFIDSIMGAKTKHEEAADYDKDGYATHKAIILSKAMRKITETISREKILFVCTNQLRTKLGVMFGDPYTTSGGKAIGFHSSVRLRTKAIGKIKAKIHGIDTVVGMKTQVVVVKNRLGPPHKVINYDIYFDSGIDNFGGWLNVLKAYKIVKQSGAWYSYMPDKGTPDDEPIKFQSKDFVELIMVDEEVKRELYLKLIEKFTMKYRPGVHGGIDDIVVVAEGDEAEETKMGAQFDGGATYDEPEDEEPKSPIQPNPEFDDI